MEGVVEDVGDVVVETLLMEQVSVEACGRIHFLHRGDSQYHGGSDAGPETDHCADH